MENPHPMHQFLKHSKKSKIKIQDLDKRIINYLTAPTADEAFKSLRDGETGFMLLILVTDRQPKLIVVNMPSFDFGTPEEVVGEIYDIPEDLLVKEILNQGGDLDIDRQYIAGGSNSLVMKWIKSKINEGAPPEYTAVPSSGMRDKFSKEEWERLRILICQIFIAVAGADGIIDTKEKEAFVKFLENIPLSKEPSIKEIFPSSKSFLPYFNVAYEEGIGGFNVNLKWVKEILKQKLDIKEFQNFGRMLFELGHEIAMASGGFLGLGRKICKEEQMVLDFLVDFFNIEMVATNNKRSKSSISPDWLKVIPAHFRPQQEKIDKLENLRVGFNVPHRLFGLRILSSPSTTVKAQEFSYNRFRKRNPVASEKELLRMVLKERLYTPPVTEMTEEEIDKAMVGIDTFRDLCRFIISLDELEPATPDPLGIGRKVDEILAE